jgi:carbon starvation protein
MQRVINNDYIDATLAGLFVAVVIAIAISGVIALIRALGTPSITSMEVGEAGALPGVARG